MVLHGQPVRASTTCYGRFTLLMDRSPGFGSRACYCQLPVVWATRANTTSVENRAINTRFRYAFVLEKT